MANFIALYDSCVLYPAPLRDLLMHLALTDLFRAKWTNDIHDEWIRSVLTKRKDLTLEQLTRTRDLMNLHVRDCLVEGYQSLIQGLSLPDPNDHHVLAAAIRSSASVIVTFNLKDFPKESLEEYGIESQHPDPFLDYLTELAPGAVCGAIRNLRQGLKSPPLSAKKYLNILEQQGLPQTVCRLSEFIELI